MSKSKAAGRSSEKDLSESSEEATMTRPIVMPDVYTGEEDWIDWITNFELCARINEWDNESKTAFLAVKLKKQAQRVYRDLSSTEKQNYDELKAAMATRFSAMKHAELHKTELRFVKREKAEKLTELANRIRHLSGLAYPTIDAKFRDELCRDQFLDALEDREFRLKVRQLRPKSLDEAVTLASEVEAIEQAEDRKQTKAVYVNNPAEVLAVNSGETNRILERSLHIIEQNTEVMKEMLAAMKVNGNSTSSSSYPKQKQYRKPGTGNECYNCGQVGHFIRNCPNMQGNEQRLR